MQVLFKQKEIPADCYKDLERKQLHCCMCQSEPICFRQHENTAKSSLCQNSAALGVNTLLQLGLNHLESPALEVLKTHQGMALWDMV